MTIGRSDSPIGDPLAAFSPTEQVRYARHFAMPSVGPEGQTRLRAASVAIVGLGGLGSPAALYLAAAGVGRLGLIDFDVVDTSNLHRQVLHGTGAVGDSKLDSAFARLHDLNPDITLETHAVRLDASNALALLGEYDIVLDGSDNFATRYVVNDACVLLGKPDVYGSIFRFEGQVTVFDARRGPCYRCLHPAPPPAGVAPSCAEAGVLGILPGVIGTLQATEAIKLILGQGEPLIGRMLLYDALGARFHEMALQKNPACAVCGTAPTITELRDEPEACAPASAADEFEIAPRELAARLRANGRIVLLDVREPFEFTLTRIEGAVLVPLATLPERLGDLDRGAEIAVYCHHGQRSALATQFLRANGFAKARNLAGGIDAWSCEVDPGVRRY